MTPITTDKHVAALTILERAVCLTLSCHYLGNDRKVDVKKLVDAAAPVDADDETTDRQLAVDVDQFSATRKLVPQKTLRPARRKISQAKALLRSRAIATNHVFGERSYLIPNAAVVEVDAALTQLAADIWTEAGKIADAYDGLVDAQAIAQGPMFRRADYPTAAEVRASFAIDWDYVSFAAPDKLDSISHVLAARADAKHKARLASAFDTVVASLRGAALDVVAELDARLDVGDGDRKKTLRGTALRDLQEFIAFLPQRNLGDDDRLTEVMARLDARTRGLDVAVIKDDDALRASLRQAVGEAKAVLAGLVEDAPRRAVSFGALGSAA